MSNKRIIAGKIIIPLLTVIVLIVTVGLFAMQTFGAEDIKSISVTPADTILDNSDIIKRQIWDNNTNAYKSYSFYDVYDKDNLTLKITYKSGNTATLKGNEITQYCADNSLSFTVSDGQYNTPWGNGVYPVTYSLGNFSATVNYTVANNSITAVAVTPMRDIELIYELSGSKGLAADSKGKIYSRFEYDLDKEDYYITLTYSNGTTAKYTNYNIEEKTGYKPVFSHAEGNLAVGTHKGSITVGGVTGTFDFKIIENPVASIYFYMADGGNNLVFGKDGYYTYNDKGEPYFHFVYDMTKLYALVTYKNGNEATMSLGTLCSLLYGDLEIKDTQSQSRWKDGTHTLQAVFNNQVYNISFNVSGYEDVALPPVAEINVTQRGSDYVALSWSSVDKADGYILEVYVNDKWTKLATAEGNKSTAYKITNLAPSSNNKFRVKPYIKISDVTFDGVYTAINCYTRPAKVSGLTVKARTDTSITLSWNMEPSAEGYVIEQYKDNKWTRIGRIGSNDVTAFKVIGLSAVTTYKFRLMTFKYQNSVCYTSDYIYSTLVTNPSSVTGLKASKITDTAVTLSWDNNSTAEGYVVECYLNGKWVRQGKISNNTTTSFTVGSLNAYTEYKFKVWAYKYVSGKCYGSGSVYFTCKTKPASPKGLTVTSAGADNILISWNKNTAVDGYVVERYIDGKWTRIGRIGNNSVNFFHVTGLSEDTPYKLRVLSFIYDEKTCNLSPYTYINYSTRPTAVTGFSVRGRGSNYVLLGWNKHSMAEGYVIEQYKNEKWVRIKKLTDNNITSFKVEGVSPYNYRFRIMAYDYSTGMCSCSEYSYVQNTYHPTRITGLKVVSQGSDSIKLFWNRNPTAEGYVVEQKINGVWKRIGRIADNSTTTFTAKNLSSSALCQFRVKAFKYVSGVCYQGEYTYAYTNTIPSAVTNMRLTARGSTSLTFKWDKNPSAEGYVVEQYKNGKWVRVARLGDNNITSYTANELSPSAKYNFRVMSFTYINDKCYRSSYVYGSYYTKPRAVTNLKSSVDSNGNVTLSWSKAPSAQGYVVEQYKNGSWVRLKKITSNDTLSYTVKNLSSATSFKFRVMSYKYNENVCYCSSYTNIEVYTKPSVVSGFKVSQSAADSVTLSWTLDSAVTGYVIEQYSSGKWVTASTISGKTSGSYTISGLSPSTQCNFRIKSYKTVNSTNIYSNPVSLTAKTLPPVVRLRLLATSEDSVTVHWEKTDKVTGYIIQEEISEGKWENKATITDLNTTQYTLSYPYATKHYLRLCSYYKYPDGTVKYNYSSTIVGWAL